MTLIRILPSETGAEDVLHLGVNGKRYDFTVGVQYDVIADVYEALLHSGVTFIEAGGDDPYAAFVSNITFASVVAQLQAGIDDLDVLSSVVNAPVGGLAVDSYGSGSPNGYASTRLQEIAPPDVSGKERYAVWGRATVPTGDGSVIGSSFGLGAIATKEGALWTSTTKRGQFIGLNNVVRGGFHGTPDATLVSLYGYDPSGDTSGIIANVVNSSQASYTALYEGVGYSTVNGAFSGALKGMKAQIAPMQPAAGQNGVGFFVEAMNGTLGAAFQANNQATAGKYKFGVPGIWTKFLSYNLDNGTDTFEAFSVDQAGNVIFRAAPGIATPRKAIGIDAGGSLQVTNNAGTAVMQMQDSGVLNLLTGGRYAINNTPVVGARITGWGAPTGTKDRTTFVSDSVTLPQLAARIAVLIDDLRAHGLIGN